MDVELIAPAYGTAVAAEEADEFCRHHAPFSCVLVTKSHENLPDAGRCVVYPRRLRPFSFAASANYGIRQSSARVKVVVGIDWRFTFSQLESMCGIDDDVVMRFSIRRDFGNTDRWWPGRENGCRYLDCPDFLNCWAMTAATWERFRGLDERYCHGWGLEDADLNRRVEEEDGVTCVLMDGMAAVDCTKIRPWRGNKKKKLRALAAHKKLFDGSEYWHRISASSEWGQGLVGLT